jgi:hypothetical protein
MYLLEEFIIDSLIPLAYNNGYESGVNKAWIIFTK